MAESNVVNIQMFAVPAKPQLRQIGNYISVDNRIEAPARYFWIRVNRNGTLTGMNDFGWEFAPTQNGTYIVRVNNTSGCTEDSDTLNFTLTPVRVRLSTGSYQVPHSRTFDMNFSMTNITKSVVEIGSTTISFTLRFNNRILAPFPGVQRGIIANVNDSANSTRRLTCAWAAVQPNNTAPTTIGTLRFGAILGNTTATRIVLEDVFCTSPMGKRLSGITFDPESGTFTLLNVPKGFISTTAGNVVSGEQREENASAITLSSRPNPVESALLLDIDLNEESPVSAWIQDAMGNPIQHLMTNKSLKRGQQNLSFDVSMIPQGLYFLVVRTPTAAKTSLLSIRR
jgi:hypothetical protein